MPVLLEHPVHIKSPPRSTVLTQNPDSSSSESLNLNLHQVIRISRKKAAHPRVIVEKIIRFKKKGFWTIVKLDQPPAPFTVTMSGST